MPKACSIVSAPDRAGAFQGPANATEETQDESMKDNIYCGFSNDKHGMTQLGRIVLDGWLFGFIPETEDCAGWEFGRMQMLMDKVQDEWDKYGNLPSRLPDDLRQRHTELYVKAMQLARSKGWNPELGEDD
jgi:hypothetical protein